MKIVLSWLHELVGIGDDVDAIALRLNKLGLAVDDVAIVGAPVPGVVVAQVLALKPHPQADRIQLVDVDRGDGEALQICCGAFNMAVGDLVPLATIGTVMPNGMEIAKRKLRGEWSNGMLCSSRELELGDEHAGIRILPPGLPLGADVFAALEITRQVVFDLDITRNRPDCWSHLGVARDLAAAFGVPFTEPLAKVDPIGPTAGVSVRIDAPDLCGRFSVHRITGVHVGPSPAWLAERLTLAGMRPINNLVDASNAVMLELGRPTHAYDAAKVHGPGFVIRRAAEGEEIVTLDDVTRRLTSNDLVIGDVAGAGIGIAGVMGGATTEVDDTTTEVLLEIAWFAPDAIRDTAARLGLRSEASARFERGVDPTDAHRCARRFVELLRHTCPDAALHDELVVDGDLPATPPIVVRPARVNALLGTDLSTERIVELLVPIGFDCTEDDGALSVQPPPWRPDSTLEVDVIEEVARLYGYDHIERRRTASAHPGGLSVRQRERRLVREVLVGLGLSEAMPFPFLAPGDLERAGLGGEVISIVNPLAAEESVLRTSLLPGMLVAIARNESHRSLGVSLFELGHTYEVGDRSARLPNERERLAVALAGREAPAAVAVLDELTAAVRAHVTITAAAPPGLHATRSATIHAADGSHLGVVGEVDPGVLDAHGITQRVAWVELDLGALLDLDRPLARHRPTPRTPSNDIDLAFVVPDEVPAATVLDAIVRSAGPLLAKVALFDVYRGTGVPDGHRSLAYALSLQHPEHTLTDTEVGEVRATVIGAAAGVGAVLRG